MVVGKAVGAAITAHFAAKTVGEACQPARLTTWLGAKFDERAAQALTDFGQDDPAELREQSREALRAYLQQLAPSCCLSRLIGASN